MFTLNEKVVYPGYGVARINRIVEKNVAGTTARFFELVFLHKDMTILIPTHNLSSVGIRRLTSDNRINDLLEMLAATTEKPVSPSEATINNWNKRNKEYQGKLRSGNIQDICKIYHDLRCIEKRKDLSFGEKSLLQQTEALLVEEIALAKDMGEDKAVEYLREKVRPAQRSQAL